MTKTIIATDQAPAAIGTYSQGVKVGATVYLSGQIPLRADGTLVDGGIREQAIQVLENMRGLLAAAGAEVVGGSPDAAARVHAEEAVRFRRILAAVRT